MPVRPSTLPADDVKASGLLQPRLVGTDGSPIIRSYACTSSRFDLPNDTDGWMEAVRLQGVFF